jgi:hypothetical protein
MVFLEPIRYVVICCDDTAPVGWIDDERPIGRGIKLRDPSPMIFPTIPQSLNGKVISCESCPNTAQLSEQSARVILDLLNAKRELLAVVDIALPTLFTPYPSNLPTVTDRRHVIPLSMLCRMLGQLNR